MTERAGMYINRLDERQPIHLPRGKSLSRTNTVLIVVQSEEDTGTIIRALGNNDFDFITAKNGMEAMSNITYKLPSIIISEIELPLINGYEFCRTIRKGIKTKLIPFIFISASNEIDDRVEAFYTGADAFLAKPFHPEELRALVLSKINQFNEFYLLSVTDELTRLYNRREFIKKIHEEINNPQNDIISLCILDLDNFKQINDLYGHQMGDFVLMHLAEVLKENTSPSFFPARFGGEEFIIVFPGVSAVDARTHMEQIRETMASRPFKSEKTIFHVSFSAGIAEYPSMASNVSSLLSLSDQALYGAKKDGRDRVYIYNPIMARNDKFWEYLRVRKGFFVNETSHDSISRKPFLPDILETISSLDFEVQSIGTLIVRIEPLFNIESIKGPRNYYYDIENIIRIIMSCCENHFPSDTYAAVSDFFDFEFVILFPSVVDFSINRNKFIELCGEIAEDICLSTADFGIEISFASDVIYLEKENPRKLLRDIAGIKESIKTFRNRSELFNRALERFNLARSNRDEAARLIDVAGFYRLDTFTPGYQFFSIEASADKSSPLEILMKSCLKTLDEAVPFFSLLSDLLRDKIEYPLLLPWVSSISLRDYVFALSEIFVGREIVILIDESSLEKFRSEALSHLASDMPPLATLGITNCYIGNSILNLLSLVEFRLIIFSENIIRHIHLFKDRIKIINGLNIFAEQLGIDTLADQVSLEEEYQVLKDLGIDYLSGPYPERAARK